MRKLLLIFLLLMVGKSAVGNGVLGGHLEWHTIPGSESECILELNLYLDENSIELEQQNQFVFIFHNDGHWKEKGHWEYFDLLELKRKSSTKIKQARETCDGSSQRDIFLNTYETIVQLPYFRKKNSPKGLVVAWHPREARNGGDKNVIDSSSPYQWITTFYPPLTMDGNAVVNASPTIGQLNSFFLCKNELSTIPLTVTDSDGDKLQYRLAKPYGVNAEDASSSNNGYDIYVSDPVWASGYSDQNQIHGNPALTINENTGEITVSPSEEGQYFIGISVDEYRNGQKIGSVSFYYTLTVIDCNQQQVLDKKLYQDTTSVQTLTICQGSQATLTSKQTFPNPQPEFQWTKNGKIIWGANAQSITISEPGEYQLLTTNINGCPDSFESEAVRVSVISSGAEMDSIPPICDNTLPIALRAAPPGGTFSGMGVTGSTFDPQTAGEGKHEIRYVIEGSGACPTSVARREIIVSKAPALDLVDILYTSRDKPIAIGVKDSLDVVYHWMPPDYLNDLGYANPVSTPTAGITYTASATNAYGCAASRNVQVKIIESILIPDAFTPNNDGINETWELKGIEGYPNCRITIYNRWGEVIFHSVGYQQAFDGTVAGALQMPGVYAYTIKLTENSRELTGSVTLIR